MNIMQLRLHGLTLIIMSVIGFKIIGTEDCLIFILAALTGVVLLLFNKRIFNILPGVGRNI